MMFVTFHSRRQFLQYFLKIYRRYFLISLPNPTYRSRGIQTIFKCTKHPPFFPVGFCFCVSHLMLPPQQNLSHPQTPLWSGTEAPVALPCLLWVVVRVGVRNEEALASALVHWQLVAAPKEHHQSITSALCPLLFHSTAVSVQCCELCMLQTSLSIGIY